MNQQGKRATLGVVLGVLLGIALAIVLVIGVVDMVRDDGSDATQDRTPIDIASLGPQIGDQVPAFTLDLELLDQQRANR